MIPDYMTGSRYWILRANSHMVARARGLVKDFWMNPHNLDGSWRTVYLTNVIFLLLLGRLVQRETPGFSYRHVDPALVLV